MRKTYKVMLIIICIMLILLNIPNISLGASSKLVYIEGDTTVEWDCQATVTCKEETRYNAGSTSKYYHATIEIYGGATYNSDNDLPQPISEELWEKKVSTVLSDYAYYEGVKYSELIQDKSNKLIKSKTIQWGREATISMYKEDNKYYAKIKTKDGKYEETINGKNEEKLIEKIEKKLNEQGAHDWYTIISSPVISVGSDKMLVKTINETRFVQPAGAYVYKKFGDSLQKTSNNILNNSLFPGGTPIEAVAIYKFNDGKEYVSFNDSLGGELFILRQQVVENPVTKQDIEDAKNKGLTPDSGLESNAGTDPNDTGGVTGPGGVLMSMAGGSQIEDPTQNTNTYKPDELTQADMGELMTTAGVILGIIRNIGVVVGVIGLSAIGLRYMFASIEEKAEYKATMMPFALGCVLLMAGTTVIDFIYSVAVQFGR